VTVGAGAGAGRGEDAVLAADLAGRARELHVLLAGNGAQGEQERRVPEESIRALAGAGLFKIMVPRRYRGHEATLRTLLEAAAAVAEADGGAGWVVSLGNVCAWVTAQFPVRAQDEVFGADPEARVCGSIAPSGQSVRVSGGWRLTGQWRYVSGSWHASWAVLGFPLTDAAGQVTDAGVALIPASDYTVQDTWFVAGMKASGSNTVIAEDVFVPDHRVMSQSDAAAGRYPALQDGAGYPAGWLPMLTLTLAGPLLGLGRAALGLVTAAAATKPIVATVFARQADSVGFQIQLGRAATQVDTAYLHAYRAAGDIDDHAARGENPDLSTRARIRADASAAAEQVVSAVSALLDAHGSAGFADGSPLHRIWQDANVGARHALLTPGISNEVYGKVLLGLENDITLTV
jgi:alkylation response protein AidB-like acyl-CoA dehydrogenase